MIRLSFLHIVLVVLGVFLSSSCTSLFQSADNPTSVDPVVSISDSGSSMSGVALEHIDSFIAGIKGLENVKNYKEFSLIYPKVSEYIDSLIMDGSGSLIFSYKIVDNTIPYLYICKLTLSGDDAIIRENIAKYKTVIPPIRKIDPADPRDIVGLFISGSMNITTLYDTLLSQEVQLPPYYIDLIQQRRASIGTAVTDDCSALMLKHEVALFTQNK